jgi:transcriptional regulator with XRE-family HTH domain
MTINQRLFTVMDNKGVSNAELSKGTGIKQNTISDWRTKGTNPSSDKIYRICEYLGISCEYLLTGIEKSPAEAEDEKTDANLSADDIQFDKEMFDLFHQLNRAGKSAAISMVLGITSNPQFVDKEVAKPLSTSQTA